MNQSEIGFIWLNIDTCLKANNPVHDIVRGVWGVINFFIKKDT